MSTTEEWRPIPGHPGYEASDLGRVRSWRAKAPAPRILVANQSGAYPTVNLAAPTANGSRTYNAHAVIAAAFHGPRPEGLEVRHINGIATDNRPANLEYATHSQNMRDRVTHGTDPQAAQTHCLRGHEFDEANTRMWRGHRYCRACGPVRRANAALRAASVPSVVAA